MQEPNFNIQPLTLDLLPKTVALLTCVFGRLGQDEIATLEASLNPLKFSRVLIRLNIKALDYWVATSQQNPVGIIGLYEEHQDNEENIWLGWFCADFNFRRLGLGSALLDFAIKEAKNRNKKYLKLYTGSGKKYDGARALYEKKGFELHGKSPQKEWFIKELE